jgi:hypothetical protein
MRTIQIDVFYWYLHPKKHVAITRKLKIYAMPNGKNGVNSLCICANLGCQEVSRSVHLVAFLYLRNLKLR